MTEPSFVTPEEEDQIEAQCFADSIESLVGDLYDATQDFVAMTYRGDLTIPLGTDCDAFEARIKALTADLRGMMDGYRPGERAQ
jgi:hypothetical protein